MDSVRGSWFAILGFIVLVLIIGSCTASVVNEMYASTAIRTYLVGGMDAVEAVCKAPIKKRDWSYTCRPTDELIYKSALETRIGYTIQRRNIVNIYHANIQDVLWLGVVN